MGQCVLWAGKYGTYFKHDATVYYIIICSIKLYIFFIDPKQNLSSVVTCLPNTLLKATIKMLTLNTSVSFLIRYFNDIHSLP